MNFKRVKLPTLSLFLIIFCTPFISLPALAVSRGLVIETKTPSGGKKEIRLYSGYHALVVGAGDYQNGWPKLPNPVKDAREVAGALKQMGWKVDLLEDPDWDRLDVALKRLITGPGREKDRAILFWYSGHGYTLKEADGTKLGYIVPVDAPLPTRDETGFMRKGIDMRQIETVVKRIQSKHVLMVFDSCFSGAIFSMVRAAPSAYIEEKVAAPVRQFITAGRENEKVPDRSVFKTVFLQGITDGYADLNTDGYVTGEELGAYLQEKVVNYTRKAQHPQFGKINNPKLDKGDFVFVAGSDAVIESLSGAANKASLSVESNVTGARVFLDGRKVGLTPLSDIEVSSGEHRIRVEKSGYETHQRRIRFESGRSISLYIDLSEEGPRKARLFVEADPDDATVKILNIVPKFYQGIDLKPGRYQVEVSADGYATEKIWVSVDSGEDKSLSIRLNPMPTVVVSEKEKTFRVNGISFKMIRIPAGSFLMGSPPGESGRNSDEDPQHRVTLTKDFWMGEIEVTQGLWKAVMGNNPSRFKACGDDCPVERVTWNMAEEFIRKLNSLVSGGNFRLPTEAEWEYACRAGTQTRFSFGDDEGRLGQYAWYESNSGRRTQPTAQKKSNAWGLYDMHGNVWEWVRDWYGGYPSSAVTDPSGGRSGGTRRVRRGGSWRSTTKGVRSAYRYWGMWGYGDGHRGFRLAHD